MMKLTPIAVISGASRGAPRSGRYATNSIVALIEPQASIARISVAKTIGIVTMPWPWCRPKKCVPIGDREHAAEHEHVAVREVDQLEDAVDERVAERDQRVDASRS